MKGLGYVKPGKFVVHPEKVPFKEVLPLKLKNSVSGKSGKATSASCVQEMTLLFACLKSNNFDETPCTKEVSNFEKCWKETAKLKEEKKARYSKGVLHPDDKKLSHKQMTYLLKKYPC